MSRPRFITLEGGEGAGKSTQASLLATRLRAHRPTLLTREPGGAPNAEILRNLLLHGGHGFSPLAELMLHFAARAEHLAATIAPALSAGQHVICDRFFDSTEAYQVIGQGASNTAFTALRNLISPTPCLTLILDVSEEVAAQRQAARGRCQDRYDLLGPDFHARVRSGFRSIAAREPERCILIDANQTQPEVADAIWRAVEPLL